MAPVLWRTDYYLPAGLRERGFTDTRVCMVSAGREMSVDRYHWGPPCGPQPLSAQVEGYVLEP